MSPAATTLITLAHRSLGWLRARPILVDVLFALLVALLALADLAGEDVSGQIRQPDVLGVLLVLIGAAALIWRRAAPVAVMVFVVGISCVFYAREYGSFMAAVGISSFYAITVHEKNRRMAWISLGAAFAALFGVASFTILNDVDGYHWSNALSMTLSVGAAILAGALVRNREEIFIDTKARADRAEADRLVEAERAVARERLRIAREMHDVVAHGMSLITVQAAAAHEVAHSRPDDAARLMHSVEATGRDALAEMRRMLGVLRSTDPSDSTMARDALAPQPTLDDLDAVVVHCVEAGIPTELIIGGDPRPLSPGIELAAFRIVQEALTNVVKHGGPVVTATVELRYGENLLHIKIDDTGRGAASGPARASAGHGLIGMKERVEIYNGQLSAGPRPGGGYRVDVSLPLNGRSDNPDRSERSERSVEIPPGPESSASV